MNTKPLIEELKKWIQSLNYDDFQNDEVIKQGWSIDDYNSFEEIREKCLASQLINYNDYLIVDLDGHIVLGKWTRKKHILANGRIVNVKIIAKLKPNTAPSVNGYWIVPERFRITK